MIYRPVLLQLVLVRRPGFGTSPIPAVKLSTSVGYAFDRRLAFLRVDDVPFLKVSLDVGW